MTEFNIRTTINHQLQLDEAETLLNRCEARRRQSARRISKAFREAVTTVAVDAALIGAILASSVVLLTCMVG